MAGTIIEKQNYSSIDNNDKTDQVQKYNDVFENGKYSP